MAEVTRLRPLTKHALDILEWLASKPQLAQEINPGVTSRLLRGDLVEAVAMPSPYHTVRGTVTYLRITEAGRIALSDRGGGRG